MTGAEFVSAARTLRGVRWRHQGRSLDGVDCIGLVVLARRSLGLCTQDVTDYARRASDESMIEYCRERMCEIHASDLAPGDILVMRFGSDRHMAVIGDYPGGGLSIIHSHLPNKRVTENRLDDHFLSRAIGCFRMPEVCA